jgi:hypothetical protein
MTMLLSRNVCVWRRKCWEMCGKRYHKQLKFASNLTTKLLGKAFSMLSQLQE